MAEEVRVEKYIKRQGINPKWLYVKLNQEKTRVRLDADNMSLWITPAFNAVYNRAFIKDKTNVPPTHIPSPATGLYSMVICPVERGIFYGGWNERIYEIAKDFSPSTWKRIDDGFEPFMSPSDTGGNPVDVVPTLKSAMSAIKTHFGVDVNHITIDTTIPSIERGHGPCNTPLETINKTFVLVLHDPRVHVGLVVTQEGRHKRTWRMEHGKMLVWSVQDNLPGTKRVVTGTGRFMCVVFRAVERYAVRGGELHRWSPQGFIKEE
jgi:hypothetical protein